MDGLIAAMIGEVRHHVEEEEEQILPAFADAATNQQLSDLGQQFTEAKDQAAADSTDSIGSVGPSTQT